MFAGAVILFGKLCIVSLPPKLNYSFTFAVPKWWANKYSVGWALNGVGRSTGGLWVVVVEGNLM